VHSAAIGNLRDQGFTHSLHLEQVGTEPEAEIARLKGTRFTAGSETDENARLAESRVKEITGGDTLTVANCMVWRSVFARHTSFGFMGIICRTFAETTTAFGDV